MELAIHLKLLIVMFDIHPVQLLLVLPECQACARHGGVRAPTLVNRYFPLL
jgi:hypothetical protein